MDSTRLVQPIIVPKSNTSEIDTAIAVAMASYRPDSEFHDVEAWRSWFSDSYAKSVRRASDGIFQKLSAMIESETDDEVYMHGKMYSYRGCKAIAYEPMLYTDMPKLISKCQVAGTNFDNSDKVYTTKDTVESITTADTIIIVNDSLGMSSGKVAAQVAHGYWMSINGSSAASVEPVVYYAKAKDFNEIKKYAKAIIVDSGLTELDGQNETIIVL